MTVYTKEKDCFFDAKDMLHNTGKTQLIFKKGRKYVYVTGELWQDSQETFRNIFGQTLHYAEHSNIRKEYEASGYELRGWVDGQGSFKNN
jgi:hypothetical protein